MTAHRHAEHSHLAWLPWPLHPSRTPLPECPSRSAGTRSRHRPRFFPATLEVGGFAGTQDCMDPRPRAAASVRPPAAIVRVGPGLPLAGPCRGGWVSRAWWCRWRCSGRGRTRPLLPGPAGQLPRRLLPRVRADGPLGRGRRRGRGLDRPPGCRRRHHPAGAARRNDPGRAAAGGAGAAGRSATWWHGCARAHGWQHRPTTAGERLSRREGALARLRVDGHQAWRSSGPPARDGQDSG